MSLQQVLHFNHLDSVIDDQLGLHDLKCHHEEDQATSDLPPISIICVDELALLGLKGVLSCPGDMIIQSEVEGPTELLDVDLVLIHEAKVYGLVWINDIKLHVRGLGEGGCFVAHKLPGEGTDLI